MDITRREIVLALLGCGLAVGLFLRPALLPGRILSPADLLFEYYPWRTVRPADWARPSNALLADSVLIFEPWLAYARERLHEGALPLWNPDNMLGAPFAGNMQSAVFDPFTWLGWLWPGAGAVTFLAGVRLWLAAAGTYLLARQVLRVGALGAAVAALTFTFGAFMSVWLLYPLANVVCWLPWCWWASARLLAAPGPRRFAVLVGLAALTLLAGQPETAYQLALATGVFALVAARVLEALRPAVAARRLGLWAVAYGLGAGLAAIQLAPFVEYLTHSAALAQRTAEGAGSLQVPLAAFWTLLSPDFWGNPAHQNWWGGSATNYGETNLYSGVLPVLLAPLALAARDRRQRAFALFLLLAGLVAAGIANQWPLIYPAVTALPLLGAAANQRFLVCVEFAVALLAALGADALLRADTSRRRLAITWAIGTLLLLAGGLGVPALFAHAWFHVPAAPGPEAAIWQAAWLRAAVLGAGGSVLLIALIGWGARGRRPTALLAGLLLLVIFLDLDQAHGDYNPTIAAQDYFPATPATRFLQQQAQTSLFRTITAGWMFLPNTNLMSAIPDLAGYDGLEPQSFRDLAVTLDPTVAQTTGGGLAPFEHIQSPLLNLLNVRYVLTAPGVDPNYREALRLDSPSYDPVGEISGPYRPGQTFLCPADNLAQIQVFGATYGRQPAGRLIFHLKTDRTAASDLVTQEIDAAGLADDSYWTFSFPPLRHARGQSFYFYLEAPDVAPAQAVTVYYSKILGYARGSRLQDGHPAGGNLLFRALVQLDPDNPPFTRVLGGAPEDVNIYENRGALPRAWLVHAVATEPAAKARLPRLADPAFDPARTALLAAPLPAGEPLPAAPPPAGEDRVEVCRYAAEQVDLVTRSAAAGLLILADQDFPGWHVTVDGQEVPIVTADHALRGVYMPAGAHQVRFTYAPDSLKLGAILSAGALLLAACCTWLLRRRPGGPRPAATLDMPGRGSL